MARTVSGKMGIKEGIRAIFIGAPETALEAIDPPRLHPDHRQLQVTVYSRRQAVGCSFWPRLDALILAWSKFFEINDALALL